MSSKITAALSKPNFTSTLRKLPPYKLCPYGPYVHNPFCPTAALPTARLEENICPTRCSHTAHKAFKILAPFSSQPSLLLSFSFACLTPAQHKKVYKGCLFDWSVQQSPSSSYVRLPTLLQRTCTEIKPFIILSIWIIKNVAFFFFYLSCCSLLSQAASSYLLQSLTYTQASFEWKRFSCLDAYIHEI